ncbi:MAG: alpha/beta hydrolase [Deltaproteobacteria bacterium]|nr:alpha/beta hydrolase [Deltaproteobacteria bacterium]
MSEDIKTVRELLAQMPDSSGKPVEEQRRIMEESMASAHLPTGFTIESAVADGVPAEWIKLDGAPADGAIFYLHGGGYAMGSPRTHRQTVAYIARACGVSALALNYRLAPEHPFPAAVEDAVAGYRWLLKQGIKPAQIAIAGDSAGGGLTLATLLQLRDSGDPPPACGICLSPWADLTCSSETYISKAETDPMISQDIKPMSSMYLNGQDPKTPLASPVFADLTGLPPILIQVGSEEMLLGDSLALARRAGLCSISMTLEIWKDMIHVWHMFSPILREGRDAIENIGTFYRDHIK